MWDTENRGKYDRSKLRYPSDLTDNEWALFELLIPPANRGGNKRTVSVRGIVTWSAWSCTVPAFRIEMVRQPCWAPYAGFIPGCGTSLPMAAMRATS